MTPQQVYDHVKAHLTKQGRRAVNDLGHCLYRTPDNLACAVGCLLTDEEAHELDKISDGSSLAGMGVEVLPSRLQPHYDLLTELQKIHDDRYDWVNTPPHSWLVHWGENMTAFAEEKGLTP